MVPFYSRIWRGNFKAESDGVASPLLVGHFIAAMRRHKERRPGKGRLVLICCRLVISWDCSCPTWDWHSDQSCLKPPSGGSSLSDRRSSLSRSARPHLSRPYLGPFRSGLP